jgi:cytidine deaminase
MVPHETCAFAPFLPQHSQRTSGELYRLSYNSHAKHMPLPFNGTCRQKMAKFSQQTSTTILIASKAWGVFITVEQVKWNFYARLDTKENRISFNSLPLNRPLKPSSILAC